MIFASPFWVTQEKNCFKFAVCFYKKNNWSDETNVVMVDKSIHQVSELKILDVSSIEKNMQKTNATMKIICLSVSKH